MQQSFRSLLTGLALIGVVSTPALAQTVTTVALLNGADVPTRSVLTGAVGAAQFTIDLGKSEVSYDIMLFDLATRLTGAHIHIGGPGLVGPIVFDLRPASQSGDVNSKGTLTRADVKLSADLGIRTAEDALKSLVLAGTYLDVHTERNGDGEIRGQIFPTDMPTTGPLRAILPQLLSGRW